MTIALADLVFRNPEVPEIRQRKLNDLTGYVVAATAITTDPTIVAFAGLVGAADKVPYFNGVDTMALADLTASARTFTALTAAQGDLLYGSAAGTFALLAKSATATRYLSNTGAANAPAWAQIDLSNGVTGDLPFANLTQGTARSVLGVTGNATADVAAIQGTANQVLVVNSTGTALTFGALDLSTAGATGTLAAARMPALTGDVTTSAGGVATTIGAGKVTLAMQANMATASVVYRKTAGSGAPEVQTLATLKTDLGLTGTNSGDQTITLTGDVTGSGTGSFAATIGSNKVTFAKFVAASAASIVGATATGNFAELTPSSARTVLSLVPGTDVFTQRTITGTANQITVTNGSGASANPTLSLPTIIVNGDQAFAGNTAYFALQADSTQRFRLGYYDQTALSLPTGLVAAQILCGSIEMHIATRDNASGAIVFHAGTGIAEIARINSTALNLASGKVLQVNGTQVLTARQTGWTADTGTNKRTANATYSGTAEAAYTQATIQALMDAVRDQSQAMKALKADLFTHGIIGT